MRGDLTPLSYPLHSPSIEQAHIPVTVVLEKPERPAGEPVVVVAIEHNRGVVAHPGMAEPGF